MRLFVALDLEPAIRERLALFRNRVKPLAPAVRWVGPETFHVTLQFLGEVQSATGIQKALSEVRSPPVALNIRGTGFFPNARAPRVFWVGIESDERLQALADGIAGTLEPLGFEREHGTYQAHLTLARAGSGRPHSRPGDRVGPGLRELATKLEAEPVPEFGTMTATEFFLYESKLSPSGAHYAKLSRHLLTQDKP